MLPVTGAPAERASSFTGSLGKSESRTQSTSSSGDTEPKQSVTIHAQLSNKVSHPQTYTKEQLTQHFAPQVKTQELPGTVVRGYGAAGSTPDRLGTIQRQAYYFKTKGLYDFNSRFPNGYKSATLNVKLDSLVKFLPDHTLPRVPWHSKNTAVPGETFHFTHAEVRFEGEEHIALLYIIDPKTKLGCHQDPQTVEVIAEPIPNIKYGDKVTLLVHGDKVTPLADKSMLYS